MTIPDLQPADWKAGRAMRVRFHPHPLHEDDLPCRHSTLPPREAPPHPHGHPKKVPRCPRRRGLRLSPKLKVNSSTSYPVRKRGFKGHPKLS